jgi:iron complex outermembrane receptor protein
MIRTYLEAPWVHGLIMLLLGWSQLAHGTLDPIVVTGIRESQNQHAVAGAIGVANSDDIAHVMPSHPAELLNRIPGVHVNNLGGEGHMTAIRQPITTQGVYLFLEDGIPTRPPGLFNHNALYEVNVAHAHRVEVIKGPGSALYGSDSIGGIINTITQPAPAAMAWSLNPEWGSYGWRRFLTSVGGPITDSLGIRVNANSTQSTGFRDHAAYTRHSGSIRLDHALGLTTDAVTHIAYTSVQQRGVSALNAADYYHRPHHNNYRNSVGRRDVQALRISTAITHTPSPHQEWAITPFFRSNRMQLMPSWMLSYDPNDRDYRFQSYGALLKHRYQTADQSRVLITGLDLDYTPSTYTEYQLTNESQGSVIVNTTQTPTRNYDFRANQLSASPYIHTEWQHQNLRIIGGLRYDYFSIDYTDRLTTPQTAMHRRPRSQVRTYAQTSPKFDVIYALSPNHSTYTTYRQSFRAPGIGELFRSGKSLQTDQLKPVQTTAVESGIRGSFTPALTYSAAAYHMVINNDILTITDTNTRRTINAGTTVHDGLELGLNAQLNTQWQLHTGVGLTRYYYRSFTDKDGDYTGNTVARSPITTGTAELQYQPVHHASIALEGEHVGGYYVDETNTDRYPGHTLLNLRAQYHVSNTHTLYGRMMNLGNVRYSTYTSKQVGPDKPVTYRPGQPRTVIIGLKSKF